VFGDLKVSDIDQSKVDAFVGKLRSTLEGKATNNVLMILGTSLKYAEEIGLIAKAPRTIQVKCERPEIEFCEFEEYIRLVNAAKAIGQHYLCMLMLAGECGLRVGEICGARWEDLDMVARTVRVTQQLQKGLILTPKGGKRRTVPMTQILWDTLTTIQPTKELRQGLIFQGLPKSSTQPDVTDERQVRTAIIRITRKAQYRGIGWHVIRHTWASHCALFGADIYTLQAWLGHSGVHDTLGYIRLAKNRRRPLPEACREVARVDHESPDDRVVAMLNARHAAAVANTLQNEDRHLKLVM
jgi:integrase